MAVTFEYGRCAQCNEEQSKTLQECRKCNAPLPWAKGAKKAVAASSSSGGGIGLGDIAWGAMSVQIIGGLVFLLGCFLWAGNRFHFFHSFPFAGYIGITIGGAIWGAGSRMDG